MPLAIALLTFLVFSGVLRNQFLNWDDDTNFLTNLHYRGLGWTQIRWMFTTVHLGHYIPLTWLTLGLDFKLWGMDPAGYHLTNLLLHCANAAIFYFVGRRLLALAMPSDPGSSRGRLDLAAGFSALLFALHPLRVESVAWVTERREVLACFFYLFTVLFYLKSACADKSRRSRWLSISAGFFALSLLSKISGSTLPLALLVLDIYPLERLPGDPRRWFSADARRVWLEKVPFILMAVPACLMGVNAQHRTGALLSLEKLGITQRLAQALFGLAFYIWKTLVPAGLSPLYALPDKLDPFAWPFLLSAAFVALITAAAFFARRRWPAGLAVWACYAITLAPVLGFTQSGTQIAADRYTYISSFGLTLLAAAALAVFLKDKSRSARRYTIVIVGVLLTGLSWLTWRQVRVWHDSQSVWEQTLSLYPDIALAHSNLGMALAEQGKNDLAILHYNLALKTQPDYALAHNNLGNALTKQGKTDEAMLHYNLALKMRPDYADAHYNLALALAGRGRLEEAILHYNLTLKAQPDYALAHNNLANALADQGKYDEAVMHYNLALQARPDLALAYNNLANALIRQGNLDSAVLCYRQALKLNPGYEQARRNLEIILRRLESERKSRLLF